MKRIDDKIKEIEKFLEELEDVVPSSFEEYTESLVNKAACERYIEKIVEAAIDLAFLVIRYQKLETAEDDIDALKVLSKNKIIDQKSEEKLSNAKRMRNRIAHQYGRIDDKIVFKAISENLEKDIKEFIDEIKNKF